MQKLEGMNLVLLKAFLIAIESLPAKIRVHTNKLCDQNIEAVP